MNKFFRNIRKGLIGTGKTSKYFKYAIGEIILVMIGILLALQVNNWNEKKAKENLAYNQLKQVQEELLLNIQEFDKYGNYYLNKLEHIRSVLQDSILKNNFNNDFSLIGIMGGYEDLSTQREAFESFIKDANNLPIKYKPLIKELKQLYNLKGLEKMFSLHDREHLEYFEIIKTKDWFLDGIYKTSNNNRSSKEIEDFHLQNIEFLNLLADFSFNVDDIVPKIRNKQYKAIEIYQNMIKLGFPNNSNGIIESMNLHPNKKLIEQFLGHYTNKNDTIKLKWQSNKLICNTNYNSSPYKVFIRDSSTLVIEGGDYEFNTDYSEFYLALHRGNLIYTKIESND